ncbi:hypothetical protein BDF19DRAFT_227263 [Syncephalis fuscata]|nr:hypothetical protein BDF19DRAFT_227263 [Syncephalis fuscata]
MFARWLYGDQASPARLSQIPTAVNTVESTTNLNGRTDCLLGASSIDSSRDHKMPLTGELGPSEERSVAIVDDTDTAGTCEPTLSTIEPTPPTVNRLRTRAVTMSADDMHSSIEAMAILPARPRSCTLSPGASFHPPLTHTIPRLKSSSEASSCYHCGNQFSFYRRKHHCHYCGSVCCYSCTQPRSLLPQFGYYDPVSVCDYCNKFIP